MRVTVQRNTTRQHGFTLVELLTTLAVLSLLSLAASHTWQDLVPRLRVKAATADIHALIRKARADAITDGNQLLCDGEKGCLKFARTQRIWVGHDKNQDGTLSSQEIREDYTLPKGVVLVWKRFKGNALLFHNGGNAHFQNGSFYLCNDVAARRIVMNWIGRPRVEPAQPEDCA